MNGSDAQLDFTGRTALITGAGSPAGIGFSTARLIGRLGGEVHLVSTTSRIHERVNELAGMGIRATGHVADLTDRRQVNWLVSNAVSQSGRIDALVNNAGMAQVGWDEPFTRFAETTDEVWDREMERNLTLCYNVTRAVLPHMIGRGYGRIVNVSSVTGPLVSNPGEAAYSAAKAAIVGMSRAIAIEVARQNVMINSVLPGWIETASQTEQEACAARHTPIGRGARPEEVGHMIVFLASAQASYITGQTFVVDGGNTIQEYKGPCEGYY